MPGLARSRGYTRILNQRPDARLPSRLLPSSLLPSTTIIVYQTRSFSLYNTKYQIVRFIFMGGEGNDATYAYARTRVHQLNRMSDAIIFPL